MVTNALNPCHKALSKQIGSKSEFYNFPASSNLNRLIDLSSHFRRPSEVLKLRRAVG